MPLACPYKTVLPSTLCSPRIASLIPSSSGSATAASATCAARQLVQLPLHYLLNQPERICVVGQDNPSPDADAIATNPRMIAFVDVLPGTRFCPQATELDDGRVVTFFSPPIEKLQQDGGTLPVAYPESTATDAGSGQRDASAPGRLACSVILTLLSANIANLGTLPRHRTPSRFPWSHSPQSHCEPNGAGNRGDRAVALALAAHTDSEHFRLQVGAPSSGSHLASVRSGLIVAKFSCACCRRSLFS